MIATVAVIAGLVIGLLAGILAKPSRQQYCVHCYSTLSCPCHPEAPRATPHTAR